jgi:thiol-disulfide isomerase/thioredoxin
MRSLTAGAALALAVLTGCSTPASPAYDPDKTLSVAAPDLVALKSKSAVPDCPKVTDGAAPGGMPSVTVPCLGGGRSVDLAGLRGPMIVNFWASWCGGCRREMPALAAYARAHPSVKVVGIDFLDPQPAAALQLAVRSDVRYPLLADTRGEVDEESPLIHIPGLPLTVFLAADGSVTHIEARTMSTERDVAATASRYLGAGG